MPSSALTSAEISLPSTADAARVQERIAVLADTVDMVGLTDNHAGQSRMSPLAAVALAREQGVRTVVHVSCRDRNRLALQSQVVGAAALGSEGVLCLYGDPVDGIAHVKDLTTTALIATAKQWAAPQELAVGAVVNPFAPDLDRELRLLERKIDAGADFVQSQMVFDRSAFERVPGASSGPARRGALLRGDRPSSQRADGRPSATATRLRRPGRGLQADQQWRRSGFGNPAGDGVGRPARGRCPAHLSPRRRGSDSRGSRRVSKHTRRSGASTLTRAAPASRETQKLPSG